MECCRPLAPLSREPLRRTSAAVTDLFDRRLRSLRRDRAARIGVDMFLYDRAFDDCLDRLRDVARTYGRALILGCPSADWPDRLKPFASEVETLDPGGIFADRSAGTQIEEDRHDYGEDRYDLCVAIGTLDTVNELPIALQLIRRAMRRDAPLIGAIAGGNSLSALRTSFIEAGRAKGKVAARTHPRIEAPTLAQLLSSAGFSMPVVDIDRVTLRYSSLDDLVRDLRSMGATSVLAQRPSALGKNELLRARQAFTAQADVGKTPEIVEILHFLAWNQ